MFQIQLSGNQFYKLARNKFPLKNQTRNCTNAKNSNNDKLNHHFPNCIASVRFVHFAPNFVRNLTDTLQAVCNLLKCSLFHLCVAIQLGKNYRQQDKLFDHFDCIRLRFLPSCKNNKQRHRSSDQGASWVLQDTRSESWNLRRRRSWIRSHRCPSGSD